MKAVRTVAALAVAAILLVSTQASAELSVTRRGPDWNPTITLTRTTAAPATSSLIAHIAVYGDNIAGVVPHDWWSTPVATVFGNLTIYLLYRDADEPQTSFSFDITCQYCDVNAQMIDVPGTVRSNSVGTTKSNVSGGTADYFIDGDLDEATEPYVIGFHTIRGGSPGNVTLASPTAGTPWATIAQIGDEEGEHDVSTSVHIFDANTNTTQYVDVVLTRADSEAYVGWLVWLTP